MSLEVLQAEQGSQLDGSWRAPRSMACKQPLGQDNKSEDRRFAETVHVQGFKPGLHVALMPINQVAPLTDTKSSTSEPSTGFLPRIMGLPCCWG